MLLPQRQLQRSNASQASSAYDAFTRHHRIIVHCIEVLAVLACTFALHGIISGQSKYAQDQTRVLQDLAPSNHNVVIEPPRDCSISRPEPRTMEPTMIASYPGSGAKLTWKLTRAITGIMTGDDFNHNGLVSKGQVVGIKTHYPCECCSDSEMFKPFLDVGQSLLLIRHPIDAIPSYHNFMYERELGLKNHSTRAPLDIWIEWRDKNFEEQLSTWANLIKFWMDHHTNEHSLIITYEKLTKAETGPKELSRIGHFVMRGEDLASPEEDIVCLWDYIVNTRADKNTRRSSKRMGDSLRPYSEYQLDSMLNEIKKLKASYPGDLAAVMDGYMSTIYRIQESILIHTIHEQYTESVKQE